MPMYFVQHGKAVAKEVDADRPLTEEGRKEVERVRDALRGMGLTAGKVCHSGKTRARQTAELLATAMSADCVTEIAGMKPNDDVAEFSKGLEDEVMYVGHLPHMGKLVSYLVTGDATAEVVAFTYSGVVCVGKDEDGYHIEWFLTPSSCSI